MLPAIVKHLLCFPKGKRSQWSICIFPWSVADAGRVQAACLIDPGGITPLQPPLRQPHQQGWAGLMPFHIFFSYCYLQQQLGLQFQAELLLSLLQG